HVHLRDRQVRLPLTPELLGYLGAGPTTGDLPRPVPERLIAELRRANPGAAIRHLPDPQPWASGVIVPDLMVAGDRERRFVCCSSSSATSTRASRRTRASSRTSAV